MLTELQNKFMNKGRDLNVITQNIDGLHVLSGTQDVIELHGSLWNVKPEGVVGTIIDDKNVWQDVTMPICKALDGTENNIGYNPDDNQIKIPLQDLPHDSKGNLLRPAVVWFGEQLDSKVMDKCYQLLGKCDMLIIIGTSGVVYPAAGFSRIVMNNYGQTSFIAEFNLESSPNSSMFDFVFEGKAGELLPDAFDVEIE